MKNDCFIVLFFFLAGDISAQPVSGFKNLRFDEDYSFLSNDSISNWYLNLKHRQLTTAGRIYLSIGGEGRYQYFRVENEDWGETPESSDGYVLLRHLLHADLHFWKRLRTFVQFQSSLEAGKEVTSPLDKNPLEFHQLFVDYNLNLNSKSNLTFRVGRQELLYGSQRLISVREGPNNRQSFDGMKAIIVSEKSQIDFFYQHFVRAQDGIFDDTFGGHIKLWGAYYTKKKLSYFGNVDIYYLGLRKQDAVFDDGLGVELRHSVGSRLWSYTGKFNYDFESVYQFGELGDNMIRAWTLSLRVSYLLANVELAPQLGLKTELISGDKKYNDRKINTFNPLFPSGAYFGLAALFGPSNLLDVHPYISFTVSDHLKWNIDYDVFWRYSKNDGIYTNNETLIYSGRGNPYFLIGHQLSNDFSYTACPFLNITGEFKWFLAEKFLKKAGTGKDILFASVSVQFIF